MRVRQDGFEHDGAIHRSLSSAVRAATGTPWNGFSFFRLGDKGQQHGTVIGKALLDIDGLTRDRDQLRAEAVYLYYEGRTWWLDTPELTKQATEEQAARYEDDPWDQLIADWVEGRESVSVAEVLTLCLEKKKNQWTQLDKNRVARCLRVRGWERFHCGPRGSREWRYRRPA